MELKVPLRIEIWEEKNSRASFLNRRPFVKFKIFNADNKELAVDRRLLKLMIACTNESAHKYESYLEAIPEGILEPEPNGDN